MFDVRRSSFICPQGVDSSLKYVESEFTLWSPFKRLSGALDYERHEDKESRL
jgi:hypothetical protein